MLPRSRLGLSARSDVYKRQALSRAETENDLEQLRAELAEQGYLRLLRRKGKPPKSLPPMEFTASDGTRILVGRNNRQNDQLTLKTANKNDIWLHTQNIPCLLYTS